MNKNFKEYLSPFFVLSDEIQILLNEFYDEWKGDNNPPYIYLYSNIGRIIANSVFLFDNKTQIEIFSHIESGINSDDEYLATAVATGLIEALVSESDNNTELWHIIENHLGIESKKHALAWKNFGQDRKSVV